MKKLAVALVALAFATPAVTTAQDVAPAVKRKPAATSTTPAAPQQATPTPTPAPTASVTPPPAVRSMSERESIAALTAAAGQGDAALDTSLIRVMGRLVAAGRCSEAAGLAARDGRKELASRAQQLCR